MPLDLPFTVSDRRKQGYFTIDNILLDEYGAKLGPYGLSVYAALARFANKDQECWPSHDTISKRTGVSKRQVGREIAKLIELRLISVTPRYNPDTKEHSSNLYTLLEVEGIATLTTPPIVTETTPIVRQATRTKHIKKDTQPNDLKNKYLPDEYRDVLLG